MTKLNPGQHERFLRNLRIGNAASAKAQAENRRLGIPNWYSINGVIVSDQELKLYKHNREWFKK